MKRICLLFCFFVFHFVFAQTGTWTWLSGDSVAGGPGVFGIQGVPSVNNHPPALYEPGIWKDKQGNFWLYGGTIPDMSDLWKYNPLTNEWTWVKGNGQQDQNAVYGTKGVANPNNTPGYRYSAFASWVDTSGNFWLFGGSENGNDLWEYTIGTNEWTWIRGDTITGTYGIYGTQGVPDSLNNPGTRSECCSAWTDSANNLWLFGGDGYGMNGSGVLSDLWKYNIATNEWTWMKGPSAAGSVAVYGTKGVPASTNDPGGRWTYTRWKDNSNNYWIFGGYVSGNDKNDLWKYDPGINQWTWISGTSNNDDNGAYIDQCLFSDNNVPSSKHENKAAVTDDCGRFWLFGGINSSFLFLNDLWVFDPQQLKWNWIKGTTGSQPGIYGTKGVPAATNLPSGRGGGLAWWGNDQKFYMFGGAQYTGNPNRMCDLWVFNPDTNCIAMPACLSSVVPPTANFQADKTAICENDCINYTDLSSNATSWQWSFAGGLPPTSTDQNPQVCYLTSGIYNVILVASNSGGSNTLSINNYISVVAAPPTPVITQVHGDTLFCKTDTSYISYQWYLDSATVPNATDTFLVISKSGNYNMEVTGKDGCKIAAGINVLLGLQNYMNNHVVSLSPNPVGDWFTVYGLRFTVSSVEIYNVVGQETSPPAPLHMENGRSSIDVSGLAAGIYFVQLIGEKDRWVGKFVKE